jgi:hypothetical protein
MVPEEEIQTHRSAQTREAKKHILMYWVGGNSAQENQHWEKFCPKFTDSIFFYQVLSLGTEFFLLFLRKV